MNRFGNIFFIGIFSFISFFSDAQIRDSRLDTFALAFIRALASENIDSMLMLKPSPEIWREIMPKETKKLSDEEIIKTVNKTEKFVTDFNNIIASAKKEKVNLRALIYSGFKQGDAILDGKIIAFELKYRYLVKDEVVFSVTLVRYNNQYYLYDILMSYNIFERYYFNR